MRGRDKRHADLLALEVFRLLYARTFARYQCFRFADIIENPEELKVNTACGGCCDAR